MNGAEKKIREKMRSEELVGIIRESAAEHNVLLYLVGGFIRDTLLKEETKDIDFAVIKGKLIFYRDLEERLGHRIITFRKKGIVNRRITIEDRVFDFVDATKIGIERELSRRDFTINSIAFSLRDERLIDPQGGLADLKKKIIRRNKRSVFRSDPLRMMRAVRLICEKRGFTIEEETLHQIKSSPEIIKRISGERIKEELDRLMDSPRSSMGIEFLGETGLLKIIIPEITPLRDLPQGKRHVHDAWNHTLRALSFADDHARLSKQIALRPLTDRSMIRILKYAVLFHDIAKPQTFSEDERGNIHFFHHEKISALVASRIMKRLRFPAKFSDAVKKLIELHLRPHLLAEATPSPKAFARLIAESTELTELLALLSLADALGTEKRHDAPVITRLKKVLKKIIGVYRKRGKEIARPERLISGEDIMQILRLPEGPEVGQILRKIHELQITGDITSRDEALQFLVQKLK